MTRPAVLALADGSIFHGESIGVDGRTVGEVVFNTAITGYQEILTDPSYYGQIVTLTQPHVGNTGANAWDEEAIRPHASGLIIRQLPFQTSNWRSEEGLEAYLKRHKVVALAGIDTRRLTRLLRDKGAQNGCILAGANMDVAAALDAARACPSMQGLDLAKVVSTKSSYEWTEGSWPPPGSSVREQAKEQKWRVVAYDYGVKRNILRILHDLGCRVTVVPALTPASEVLKERPHGVFLSNGPGDPDACDYAIDAARTFMRERVPLFGICLGHQLLGLAAGARTRKMKFGHHGANHPVQDLETGRVMITSQNHGFAVAEDTLPPELVPTHRSLFDGTLQGIRHRDLPAFGFQGHPEASPGPHDVRSLFSRFISLMEQRT